MTDFGSEFHRARIVRNGRIFKGSTNRHFSAFFKRQSKVRQDSKKTPFQIIYAAKIQLEKAQ